MIPIKTESVWRGKSDCRNCGMRDMVLFADLNEQDFGMIHAPIDDLEFKQGATLYDEGSRAQGVFTVRTGMIKLVRVLRPGDVAGLEALATSRYDCEAVALTDVAVCRIPLDVIHTLGAGSHRLHHMLMQKWQKALKDADDWLADLNFGTARQRVSNLILKMRSPADSQISTLFARDDMGAMLNLKLETVSREVSRLVREEVIAPQDRLGRVYRVQQLARLQVT